MTEFPEVIHSSLRKEEAVREFIAEERTLAEATLLAEPDAQAELGSSQTPEQPVLEDVPPATEVGLGTPAGTTVAREGTSPANLSSDPNAPKSEVF